MQLMINMKELKLDQYHNLLYHLSIQKEFHYGIVLEEKTLCRQSLGFQYDTQKSCNSNTENPLGSEPWERDGLIHEIWIPSEIVEIKDKDITKYIVKSVDGNYGFQRSMGKRLGLNIYLGWGGFILYPPITKNVKIIFNQF